MRRVYCDGCWKRNIETDLTDLAPDQRWRVQLTRATILDLCMDCAPKFQKFDLDKQRLLSEHSEQFKVRLKELMDNFWKELEATDAESART